MAKSLKDELTNLEAFEPRWNGECDVCGASPTVSATDLCGPCTFGESDTVAGGWWDADDDKRLATLRSRLETQEGK